DWIAVMAVINLPPILALPLFFRLSRSRLLLVIVAAAGITVAQLLLRVPPNLYAVQGYVALAGMARLARDDRDLCSALLSVASGVLVGLACGYNPCTPIEIILAPLTGIIVRLGFRIGWRGDLARATRIPAVSRES